MELLPEKLEAFLAAGPWPGWLLRLTMGRKAMSGRKGKAGASGRRALTLLACLPILPQQGGFFLSGHIY